MTHQSELAVDPFFAARVFLDQLEVLELSREAVGRECFGLGKRFAVGADAAPREIKSDRRQFGLRELAGEIRKERPVSETLEAVADHDGTDGRRGTIQVAADGQAVATRDLERRRRERASGNHPSISPSISDHPCMPPDIDATSSYPICFIVSAASADRFPRAQ